VPPPCARPVQGPVSSDKLAAIGRQSLNAGSIVDSFAVVSSVAGTFLSGTRISADLDMARVGVEFIFGLFTGIWFTGVSWLAGWTLIEVVRTLWKKPG